MKNISVVGLGYVGLSLSTLISRHREVIGVDVWEERVKQISNGISPLKEKDIEDQLASGKLKLRVTTDVKETAGSEFVIVATPTNYDPNTKKFDTSSVDAVIDSVSKISPESTIVIKSTIPIGYVKSKYEQGYRNVMFSPEFLREGRALYDNLHPSRIIVGIPSEELRSKAETFAKMLFESSEEKDVPVMIMHSSEAESVKLFANTYLAMRISFFNEMDSYAEQNGLDTKSIIEGVSADPRVGNHYNNPSFGYGGYCLPKDTKQLLNNYSGMPCDIIHSIVTSNDTRKDFVTDRVMKKLGKGKVVGLYRLTMKLNSDNFRESSIMDIAKRLTEKGIKIIVFEPCIGNFKIDYEVENDLDAFVGKSDVILANRIDSVIEKKAGKKLYSRDVFTRE